MSFASLSGIPVLAGRMVIPFAGMWHASLVLATDTPSPGPQPLLIGATTWACTPVRDGTFAGQRGVLLVGGTGGWRTSISPKQYGQGTVPVQAILADAAVACGELPPVGATGTVSAYCRKGSPSAASACLQELLADAWWCDNTGTVRATPRLPKPIVSPFQAMATSESSGIYEIATEALNDWAPGSTFIGPTVSGTVSRSMYVFEPGSVRLEVMVS